MVAIKAGNIEKTLQKPAGFDAYLIFGPDQGLVRERSAALINALQQSTKDSEVIKLLNEDIANDPARISLDLKTISMFGERKILRLENGPALNPSLIETLLNDAPFEADLIIEAGDLKKTAKLRKLFESAANTAAIACYQDNAQSLKQLVKEVLSNSGLMIAAEAEQYLISRLGANRALSRNELEKLVLYATGKNEISINDIDDVLTDMSEIAVNEIVNSVLLGKTNLALNKLNRALMSGLQPTVFFIALERQLLNLHKSALSLETGKSMEAVVKAQRPPLYYERRDIFISQLNLWRESHLAKAINACQTAFATARRRNHADLEKCELAGLMLTFSNHTANLGRRGR